MTKFVFLLPRIVAAGLIVWLARTAESFQCFRGIAKQNETGTMDKEGKPLQKFNCTTTLNKCIRVKGEWESATLGHVGMDEYALNCLDQLTGSIDQVKDECKEWTFKNGSHQVCACPFELCNFPGRPDDQFGNPDYTNPPETSAVTGNKAAAAPVSADTLLLLLLVSLWGARKQSG